MLMFEFLYCTDDIDVCLHEALMQYFIASRFGGQSKSITSDNNLKSHDCVHSSSCLLSPFLHVLCPYFYCKNIVVMIVTPE